MAESTHGPGDDALRAEVAALLLRDEARLEEPAADPCTIGRFEVGRRIGHGGMGVVYEGYDATLDRRVALKLVRFGVCDAVARGRLLREAQVMAKVADAHVVPVYEVGEHEEQVFIAMELVEGETLAAWLGRDRRAWRDALGMYVAAGRGLAAAHARGIVHRDFKPDNVLVGTDGRARVVDFGLARMHDVEPPRDGGPSVEPQSLTLTGTVMGTPSYMSPEHFRAHNVDARSDQFCFAVGLYRALFGFAPFQGMTLLSLGEAVCSGAVRKPPPSDIPVGVVHAVLRALSPDPEARFASMLEMLDELEKPLRIDPELDPWKGRRGRRLALAFFLPVVFVGLAIIFLVEPAETTATGIVYHAIGPLIAFAVLGVVFRKTLQASAHNRRLALTFVVSVGSWLVHRIVARHFGGPVAETLIGDALLFGAVTTLGAAMLERWAIVGLPLSLVYVAMITAFPRYAGRAFGVMVLVFLSAAVWFQGEPRMRVRKKRADGVSGSSSGSRTIVEGRGAKPPKGSS